MPDTKIATCSYCGSRTVLQLTARNGHVLACGNCGAPLHEMKALRKARAPEPGDVGGLRGPARPRKRPERKRRKPKKSAWLRALEEIVDVVEDLID